MQKGQTFELLSKRTQTHEVCNHIARCPVHTTLQLSFGNYSFLSSVATDGLRKGSVRLQSSSVLRAHWAPLDLTDDCNI